MAHNGSICKLIMVALSMLSLSTSQSTEIFFHLRVMMRCYGPPVLLLVLETYLIGPIIKNTNTVRFNTRF